MTFYFFKDCFEAIWCVRQPFASGYDVLVLKGSMSAKACMKPRNLMKINKFAYLLFRKKEVWWGKGGVTRA